MLNLLSQRIQNPQLIESIRNFTAVDYTNRLIPILINVGYILCVLAFVLLLIFGGIQWITSGGSKEKLEGARSKIINAVTGLFILFILWVILKTVNVVFGINLGNVGVPYVGPSGAPTPFYMSCGGGSSCIPISGLGTNECGGSGDCMGPGYYLTCSGGSCSRVVGTGTNTCFPLGSSCTGSNAHYGCVGNQCVLVAGVGTDTCTAGLPCNISVGGNCTTGSNCVSGFCNSNVDADADGFYAATSLAVDGVCSASPSDCNDNNNLVFPGQTQYFQDPVAGTTNNFNYDCVDGDGDGDPNDRWPQLNCLSSQPHYTSCQTTPLTENVMRPLTGFENWIPVCGENLIHSGAGPTNEFFSCNASHYPTCVANPEVSDFSCFADCYTGNTCGWGNDLACISWRMNGWPVWPSAFSEEYPGGLYRMPCR
jgi:hypothetical protein